MVYDRTILFPDPVGRLQGVNCRTPPLPVFCVLCCLNDRRSHFGYSVDDGVRAFVLSGSDVHELAGWSRDLVCVSGEGILSRIPVREAFDRLPARATE